MEKQETTYIKITGITKKFKKDLKAIANDKEQTLSKMLKPVLRKFKDENKV